MKLCLDVDYSDTHAVAAALLFENWEDAQPIAEFASCVPTCSNYEPGMFYQRELDPLLAVIAQVDTSVDTFVIDAYCQLDAAGAPGLGVHLAKELDSSAAIIGIAKNRFRDSSHAVELSRGGSIRPIFVTSIGMPAATAADCVAAMAGKYRFPTLLKAVDRLARDSLQLVEDKS